MLLSLKPISKDALIDCLRAEEDFNSGGVVLHLREIADKLRSKNFGGVFVNDDGEGRGVASLSAEISLEPMHEQFDTHCSDCVKLAIETVLEEKFPFELNHCIRLKRD